MEIIAGMDGRKTPLEEMFLRKKKKALALWKGMLPMERGVSRLMWNSRNENPVEIINGQFSYDVLWVLLVLGYKAVAPGQEGAALALLGNGEEMGMAPFLEFTDAEFQKILDKKNHSSAWIEKAVLKLASIVVKVEKFKGIKNIEEDGTEHWLTYESVGPMVRADIITQFRKKRGRKAKRGRENRRNTHGSILTPDKPNGPEQTIP